jgi:hypothetical protein
VTLTNLGRSIRGEHASEAIAAAEVGEDNIAVGAKRLAQ